MSALPVGIQSTGTTPQVIGLDSSAYFAALRVLGCLKAGEIEGLTDNGRFALSNLRKQIIELSGQDEAWLDGAIRSYGTEAREKALRSTPADVPRNWEIRDAISSAGGL